MPPHLAKRIDAWAATGPYTFEAAFAFAYECSRRKSIQLGDTLDSIYHLFPPEELGKMVDPENWLSPKDLAAWKNGTEEWCVKKINALVTDEQLDVLAPLKTFHSVVSNHFYHSSPNGAFNVWTDAQALVMLKALREVDALR